MAAYDDMIINVLRLIHSTRMQLTQQISAELTYTATYNKNFDASNKNICEISFLSRLILLVIFTIFVINS